MASKKKAPERVHVSPRPAAPPTPKPKVSVFVLSLPPGMPAPTDPRFVYVSEADATCTAAKRHARVWVACDGAQLPARPNGQRLAFVKPGDDVAAKILEAAE